MPAQQVCAIGVVVALICFLSFPQSFVVCRDDSFTLRLQKSAENEIAAQRDISEQPAFPADERSPTSSWLPQAIWFHQSAQACEFLGLRPDDLTVQNAFEDKTCILAQHVSEVEEELRSRGARRFIVSGSSKSRPYSAWIDVEQLLPQYAASEGRPLVVLFHEMGMYSESGGVNTTACNVRSVQRLAQLLSTSERPATVVIERAGEGVSALTLELFESIFACAGIQAHLRIVSMSQHVYDERRKESATHAYYNGFWTLGRQAAILDAKEYRTSHRVVDPNNYRLLALGGTPRPHKAALFYTMYNALSTSNWVKIKWSLGRLPATLWPKPVTAYYPNLALCLPTDTAVEHEFNALTPQFLGLPNNVTEKRSPLFMDSPASVYSDTDIELVLESDLSSMHRYTEKTLKAIAHGHPFLIWGAPDTLNVLSADGFKTFSPFINETYDTIQNDCARLQAVVGEVNRLLSLSNAEYNRTLESIWAISEMNRNYLMGATFVKKQQQHLKTIFEGSWPRQK